MYPFMSTQKSQKMAAVASKSTIKTRARRVFGDIVTEEQIDTSSTSTSTSSSLSYSLSPASARTNNNNSSDAPVLPAPKKPGRDESVGNNPFKENLQNQDESDLSLRSTEGNDTNTSLPTRKRQELQRLRKQSKSPLRRDLVQKTQQAINDATTSVNQSLNAVRRAKAEKYQELAKETTKLRNQWRDEKEDAQQYYAQAEKSRHELLSLQRQLSSKFAKQKAKREIDNRNAQLAAIEQETNFKSDVYRTHQQTLKEEAERKRRQSIAARRKLRQNHREGEGRMHMQKIEEDQALMEERHLSSVAFRETKKTLSDKRRKSYAFRNGDARRIRELHAKMEMERQQQSHESYELKWAGEKDAKAYKKSLEEQRRKSFAFRNKEGRKQREDESARQAEEQHADHVSYVLKWAGERDAEAYKKQLEEERRKSFKFRNDEGTRQREEESRRRFQEQSDEHASYELKWAGEKDAEAYQRKLAEERRDSFAFRNREGRNQRLDEEQRQQEARFKEHQGFELKWAGEKDAEAYQRKLEQERRDSFANRNKHGRRQRELELQQKSEEMMQSHQSYELKRAGERDVDAYKKKLQEERRDSFAFRNMENHRQREEESARIAREQQAEHASYELKWAGEKDAEAYKKKLEQERRDSFKFRNEERVRHQKVMDELKSIAREQETESYVLKWAGEEDAKAYLAKLEEERRQSFQFRNREGKRHRELDEEAHQQAVHEAHVEEELQAACKFLELFCFISVVMMLVFVSPILFFLHLRKVVLTLKNTRNNVLLVIVPLLCTGEKKPCSNDWRKKIARASNERLIK